MDGVPSSTNFEGGFACELMLKDINLTQKIAHEVSAPLAFGSVTQNIYRVVCGKGHSRKDFGIVSDLFKKGDCVPPGKSSPTMGE